MNGETFVQIVIGLIMICSALVTAYIVPYIQTKTDAMELEQLYTFVKKCVQWANQTIPKDMADKKKMQVVDLVQTYIDENLHIRVSKEEIDTIIEAFVIECKKGL